MLASQFWETNITSSCSCQIKINFAGIIRSLFINNDFMLTDSSLDYFISKTVQTYRSVMIQPKKIVFVTIIGRGISIFDIGFTNCTDDLGLPTIINITKYYSMGTNLTLADVSYVANTSSCSPSCLICKNLTYCYKCQTGFYQFQGTCYLSCPYPLVPAGLKFCDNRLRNQVIRNQYPSLDLTSSRLYLDYYLDFVSNNE